MTEIQQKTKPELVSEINIEKDHTYLYYVGSDGNVWRVKATRGRNKKVKN